MTGTTENWNKPHGRGNIDPENFSPYPKNPMIARFFKEIGRVDELGSGVRNTYKYCGLYTPGTEPEFIEGDVFKTIIPIQTEQATGQPTGEATVEVSGEVSGEAQMVVGALQGEMKLKELMDALDLSHRENFKNNYLEPAMKAGFIEMTYPESPNHPNQKYRLTVAGKKLEKKYRINSLSLCPEMSYNKLRHEACRVPCRCWTSPVEKLHVASVCHLNYGGDGADYEKVLDIVLRFRKSVLVGAFAGEVVSQIQEGDRMFDLLVRFDEDHRGSIETIQNATFNLENETIVPLAELATILSRSGPNTISRENVQRVITVSANVAGRDLRGTVDEIRSNISGSISFPQG